jgi:hypothetical protein
VTPTLEARVADLVAEIVRRTEARVEQVFAEAVEAELERRRNGDTATHRDLGRGLYRRG